MIRAFLNPRKAMKKADSRTHSLLEIVGKRFQDFPPYPGHRNDHEQDAAVEDHPQGRLPRNMHSLADLHSDICIHAHAGRHGQWIVRAQGHHHGEDDGHQSRDGDQGAAIHARLGENQRVHDQHIGQGAESG